jgi:very-short-patch-repair endonuclease
VRTPQRDVPGPLSKGPFDVHSGVDWVSRYRLGGAAFRRLTRGAYVEAARVVTHRERIQALRAAVSSSGVLGGMSAAWALGLEDLGDDDPVEIVLPPAARIRARSGLRVRGDVLRDDEVVWTPLGFATSPARTAFDLARRPRIPAGVAVGLQQQLEQGVIHLPPSEPFISVICRTVGLVDALLRLTGESVGMVAEVARRHRGARGLRVGRVVIALADPRAESRPESMLRARAVLVGLPRPVPQFTVRDYGGEFVARVDLAWPDRRLAAEYDGNWHDDPEQFTADRRRRNALQLVGWRSIHFDASHLRVPELMTAELRDALG